MSGHSPSGPEGPALEMNMSEVNPALQLSVDYLRVFMLLCIKHFFFLFSFYQILKALGGMRRLRKHSTLELMLTLFIP